MAASYKAEAEAIKELLNPKKVDNETTDEGTKLTKEQEAALKKRNDELERYRQQLEDVNNSLIKDDLNRELVTTQTDFRRKIQDIKGNGETEISLRKALKEKNKENFLKYIKKYEESYYNLKYY